MGLTLSLSATSAVIEVGDLNIIDDARNASDGLRFLDMTYSDGLTLAAALASAQAMYPNARLATPSEWEDLFDAAGITVSGGLSASSASSASSSGSNIDEFLPDLCPGHLADKLGYTEGGSSYLERP